MEKLQSSTREREEVFISNVSFDQGGTLCLLLFLVHPSRFSQTLRHLPEVGISESDPKWGGVGPYLGSSSPSLRQGSPYSHVPESFSSPS